MDGASLGIVLADIVKAYRGKEFPGDYYCAYLSKEEQIRKSLQYLEDKEYFEKNYDGMIGVLYPNHCNLRQKVGRLSYPSTKKI